MAGVQVVEEGHLAASVEVVDENELNLVNCLGVWMEVEVAVEARDVREVRKHHREPRRVVVEHVGVGDGWDVEILGRDLLAGDYRGAFD